MARNAEKNISQTPSRLPSPLQAQPKNNNMRLPRKNAQIVLFSYNGKRNQISTGRDLTKLFLLKVHKRAFLALILEFCIISLLVIH
jgi:hypothetical protein